MNDSHPRNTLVFERYIVHAKEIGSSGACKLEIKMNGFAIKSNILLSALPSAREMETLLIRFDIAMKTGVCRNIVAIIRQMYCGPRLVLRVADNLTFQGRTAGGTLGSFQTTFKLLRIDNFVYIYNPWHEESSDEEQPSKP